MTITVTVPTPLNLRVTVKDKATGLTIPQVYVSLWTGNELAAEAITDASGIANLADFFSGAYELHASATGYTESVQTVQITQSGTKTVLLTAAGLASWWDQVVAWWNSLTDQERAMYILGGSAVVIGGIYLGTRGRRK